MKKIYLIDFNCVIDSQDTPIGHTLGVTQKLMELLQQMHYDVTYVCSKQYATHLSAKSILPILQSLKRGVGVNINEREIIKNNLKTIDKNISSGILFFSHFDPGFANLLPKEKKDRVNICIFYSHLRRRVSGDNFFKAILRKVYYRYLNNCINNRVRYLIKTNPNLHLNSKNIFYMPDYFYDNDYYGKYKCLKSQNKIVCLGQNNKYKKISQLIDKFKDTNYNLAILGKFFDSSLYETALSKSQGYDNIEIENSNISNEKYFSELASAQYCVLPYDVDFYFERTTGIAIEAMFLDTIVIGPRTILEFNDIPGVCYESLDRLDLADLTQDNSAILSLYDLKRKKEYSKEYTKNVIKDVMEKACAYIKI